MKKFSNIFCALVITISVVVTIILGVDYLKNRKILTKESSNDIEIATLKPKEDKVQVTFDSQIIQDGLEGMGTLTTQKYYFSQIGHYKKPKKIVGSITSTLEFTYSYDGVVTAGIDFEKITVACDEGKKIISIKLPESEIQDITIDNNTFKKYSEKDYLWNPIKLEDYNLSLAQFKEEAKEKALERGILDEADKQAKTLVGNFVRNFPQASEYEIVFE